MSNVPPFKQYYASVTDMNPQQKRFYELWLKAWQKGQSIDVEGNVSYLFCYVYSILAKNLTEQSIKSIYSNNKAMVTTTYGRVTISARGAKDALPALINIRDKYSHEINFVESCSRWISDCFVILHRYKEAIDAFPPLFPSSRSSYQTDCLLSLKANIGGHISGRDVLTLCGPKVTGFGNRNLENVMQYIEAILRARENNTEVNTLMEWIKLVERQPYQVFGGTVYVSSVPDLECFLFSQSRDVIDVVTQFTREAENTVREESGLPKVGEGWISETELYYKIKSALLNLQIEHHARPDWLHNQHLDIYLPELGIAIEYQGLQHEEPIEYFGGQQAFEKRKRLDEKKRRLCQRNNVRLIYVYPDYVLQHVLKQLCHP